jgi:hypothetical protein
MRDEEIGGRRRQAQEPHDRLVGRLEPASGLGDPSHGDGRELGIGGVIDGGQHHGRTVPQARVGTLQS